MKNKIPFCMENMMAKNKISMKRKFTYEYVACKSRHSLVILQKQKAPSH